MLTKKGRGGGGGRGGRGGGRGGGGKGEGGGRKPLTCTGARGGGTGEDGRSLLHKKLLPLLALRGPQTGGRSVVRAGWRGRNARVSVSFLLLLPATTAGATATHAATVR